MHDLLPQTQLQQAHARPVPGEELEVLGKHAASHFLRGDSSTLTDAVVQTVKRAGLSPEQVRRVVEFANQSAYQSEFNKESSDNKYIEFHGGPAHPGRVLQDLNDGGGGTVFDWGTLDYKSAPSFSKTAAALVPMEKTASVFNAEDYAIEEAFKIAAEPVFPYVDPFDDVVEMQEKVAGLRDFLNTELSSNEILYNDICGDLYEQVKQAALNGTPLGHIVQAWASVDPEPGFVKAAFQRIGPRLVDDGVMSLGQIGDSLMKTAGSMMVVTEHPIVQNFAAFCETLTKLATLREQLNEANEANEKIVYFMKKSAGAKGLIPKAWAGAKDLAQRAAGPAQEAVDVLAGQGSTAGKVVGKAVEVSPYLAAAAGGKEVYDRGVKYGPLGKPVRYASSLLPGTQESMLRQMQLQQNGW